MQNVHLHIRRQRGASCIPSHTLSRWFTSSRQSREHLVPFKNLTMEKKSCIHSSLVISDTSTTVWSTYKTCILPTNVPVHPYATEYYKHYHKPSNMRSGIGSYACFSLERQQGTCIVPTLKVNKSPW